MAAGEKGDDVKIGPLVPDRPPRSVGFLISQLGFVSAKGFHAALAPVGIDPREFSLLRFIAAADGSSQQALAERVGVPASRMVALVDRLESEGLVERRAYTGDRRVRALHLTDEGRTLLERAGEVAIEYEKRLCAGLESDEREQLIDLLHKIQAGQIRRRGVHPGLGTDFGPGDN